MTLRQSPSGTHCRWISTLTIVVLLLIVSIGNILAQGPVNQVKQNDAEDLLGNMEQFDLLEEKGSKFELRGLYKNMFMFQRVKNYYEANLYPRGSKNLATDLNRLRLSPEFRYAKNLVVHIDYDNEVIFSNYNKTKQFDSYWRPSGYNDFLQMNWDLAYRKEIYYRMKIHRAFAKMTLGDLTVTAGRQQIRFGSGRLWNPLDILNPVSPTFIEGAEDQKGTDAVKIDYFFDEKTELSLVYNPKRYNDDFNRLSPCHANSAVRFKTTIINFEIALLAGYISKRITGGTDITATVFDGLLRGSIVYARPDEGDTYIQAGAGYEYTFRNGVYFLMEYFYNENGLNYNGVMKNYFLESVVRGVDQSNYTRLSNQLITFNQHYAGLALGYDFHPLLRGELFTIYDFQGRGIFWTISLKYNMRQNTDLNAGLMMSEIFGDQESSDFTTIHRQYIYFLSLVHYF